MNESVLGHYDLGNEATRLPANSLERLRTESILARFLPKPPAVVFDIGGADGVYAFPLSIQSYEVHLVDPVKLHIDQANKKNKEVQSPLKSISVGDARKLNFENESADVVLYFGPLYHLTEKSDRDQALREAFRVLKKGGVLISAHISKFTSLIDGIRNGFLSDPDFVEIVNEDLKTSRHQNPRNHPGYFTEAYFQHPHEARDETKATGFSSVDLLSIEGPIWMIQGLNAQLSEEGRRSLILNYLEQIERDETIIGASSHYATVAIK
jgi:ubiquinone/menaquinone biosynthesis C-methylase UbiE